MNEPENRLKMEKKSRARWGDGRVIFFALLPQIADELDSKIPITRIYSKHKDRLGISYRQFIRLVREYETKNKSVSSDPSAPAAAAKLPAPPSSVEPHRPIYTPPQSRKERDFHYDPVDAYTKKYD